MDILTAELFAPFLEDSARTPMTMILLLTLAILPGIAICLFVYYKDKYEKEPWQLLIKTFIGGVLITVLAAFLEFGADIFFKENHSLWMVAVEAFLIVALIEEGCKYYLLTKHLYPNEEFNEPFDGIIYSVIISMGFATFENIFYVFRGGVSVAILRMITAVPAHATFGVLMGFFVGLAKFRNNSAKLRLAGLFTAVFFHGAYDFFLFQDSYPALTHCAFVVLAIGIILSLRGMQILNHLSPFKNEGLLPLDVDLEDNRPA